MTELSGWRRITDSLARTLKKLEFQALPFQWPYKIHYLRSKIGPRLSPIDIDPERPYVNYSYLRMRGYLVKPEPYILVYTVQIRPNRIVVVTGRKKIPFQFV